MNMNEMASVGLNVDRTARIQRSGMHSILALKPWTVLNAHAVQTFIKSPWAFCTKKDLCIGRCYLPSTVCGCSEVKSPCGALLFSFSLLGPGRTLLAPLMFSCLLCRLTFQDSLPVRWQDSRWPSKVGSVAWKAQWTDPSRLSRKQLRAVFRTWALGDP